MDSVVYLASALLGALVGGLISLLVSSRAARRAQRTRYGEGLLESLTEAQRHVVAALSHLDSRPDSVGHDGEPIVNSRHIVLTLRDDATRVWARTEIAATMEFGAGHRAMQAWGLLLHQDLSRCAPTRAQLEWMEHRLDLAVYLVIAWTARYAKGVDFARSGRQIEDELGPTIDGLVLPDYGTMPPS